MISKLREMLLINDLQSIWRISFQSRAHKKAREALNGVFYQSAAFLYVSLLSLLLIVTQVLIW